MKTKGTDLTPVGKIMDLTNEHGSPMACSCTYHCETSEDQRNNPDKYYCEKCGGKAIFGYSQKELGKIWMNIKQKNDEELKYLLDKL